MITKEQITPLILEACPSFAPVYQAECDDDEKELTYIIGGYFADHLFKLFQKGETAEFPVVAELIEKLHINGDKYTKDFATIGILESVQNVWDRNKADSNEFYAYLLPVSQRYWQSLYDFWSQKVPYVGFGITEA